MTSFQISQFDNRKLHPDWELADDCPFCKIIAQKASSYRLYEDEYVIAILDILPIRPGHALVFPKVHIPRLTDLPPELSRALGEAVTKVGNALTQALDNPDLNCVCNQGYAQVVPHVHFHIIPAPPPPPHEKLDPSHPKLLKLERKRRDELDHEDGMELVKKIQCKL